MLKKKGRKTGREKIRAAIILSESRPRRCSAGTKMSAENHGKMISCFFFFTLIPSQKNRENALAKMRHLSFWKQKLK